MVCSKTSPSGIGVTQQRKTKTSCDIWVRETINSKEVTAQSASGCLRELEAKHTTKVR